MQYLLQGDGALDNVPNTGLWIVAQPESTHSENVARAIVRFRDQLRNRGIELLVVPVPGKASIYPDRLTRRVTASQVLRSPTATLLSDLQREGIATVDLFELFRSAKHEARGSSEGEPLYLATDTHWTPYGARLAAEVVAQRVLQMGCGPEFAWELPVASIRVARRGDVPQMTEVPGLAESFPPQVVTCTQVTDKIVGLMVPPPGGRDGTYMSSHLKDSPREPTVLLLGDSYSRIYQLPEPRSLGRVIHSSGDPVTTASEPLTAVKRWLPGSAGFPSLLAEALQTPIDYIISDGGAATDVRQRLSLNAEILENKLIVVWEFTERDIALGRQGWQDVPLPPELYAPCQDEYLNSRGGAIALTALPSLQRDTAATKVFLQLRDADQLEMEHGGRQQDRGTGFHCLVEMFQFAGAAGGHDLGRRGLFHGADHGQIVPGLGSIAGLAGGEDHRHAERIDFLGPFDGVGAGGGATAVDVHFVAGRHRRVLVHIDRHGHFLSAEFFDHFGDDFRLAEGGAAGGHLSAPASSTAAAEATSEIPPPTVKGTVTTAATRFTTSSIVPRPSTVAVMSSRASSSAPALQ